MRGNAAMHACRLMLVAALLALAGCGGKRSDEVPLGQVEGQVLFRGAPVAEGTVTVNTPDGRLMGETKLDKEGRFVIKTDAGGLPVGEYVITITPLMYLDSSDPHTPAVMEEKKAPNIPEKYRRMGSTPLRFEIAAGPNKFTWDLAT